MRTSARLLVAGLASLLAVAILPASGADAAGAQPNNVYCCR
jgi:hypothetical protein